MMKLNQTYIVIFISMTMLHYTSKSQSDFNVTHLNNPAPGYLLFDWYKNQDFCYVDNYGYRVLNKLPSNGFKLDYFKLLNNGFCIDFEFSVQIYYCIIRKHPTIREN
jgi:hypothetical protein